MLTKFSWDPGQLTSARRAAARDQLPRRDTQTPQMDAPGNQAARTREVKRRAAPEETALAKYLVP